MGLQQRTTTVCGATAVEERRSGSSVHLKVLPLVPTPAYHNVMVLHFTSLHHILIFLGRYARLLCSVGEDERSTAVLVLTAAHLLP